MNMNEPKLRFKADDGSQFPEWEEKKIGDITLSHNAGVYIAKDNYGTGTNIIGVGDIYESDVINGKQYRLAPVDSDEYILDEGDLVYGESSLVTEGIARTVCISAAGKGTAFAWHTRRYKVDRTIINPYFLTLQVNYAKRVRNHLMRVCTRNALTGMTTNEYFGTKVSVPCLPEQQKIAEFLSTIDTVIEKQKETVSAWEERKKGVMQKLFSQEVRFKADDGSEFPEWEEKSYLSICNVFADGDWIESKDQSDSGIRLIQTGNIGNGVFIDKDDKKKYISKETFDRLKCNEVFEGDILISRLPSPAGRACIVPKLNERMITAVDCTIVRTDKSIILHDYCVQFMQSSKHFYYVASMMAGGTRQRISRKNLEDELISVPCLEEQQKIADCLSSLDEVIENQKATLAAWEELKKGLLQQMFV